MWKDFRFCHFSFFQVQIVSVLHLVAVKGIGKLPTEIGLCVRDVINDKDMADAVCLFGLSKITVNTTEVLCDELSLEGKNFQSSNMNIVCSDGWKNSSSAQYRCEPDVKSETQSQGISFGKIVRDTSQQNSAGSSVKTGEKPSLHA